MEPTTMDGFEVTLEIHVEELEEKNAPGDLVWPFPGAGLGAWAR
jgi:hypothetical protein